MIGYFDKIRNFYLLAYLPLESAMLITLMPGLAGIGPALWLSENVKERLQKEGYVQVRTRAREIDFGINVAVCGAWFYWMKHTARNGGMGWVEGMVKIAIMLAGMDVLLFQMMLGSTVWYTARAR